MTTTADKSSRERLHIVLVPGFGGFDALGQIEYYSGTTRVAELWRDRDPERREGRDRVVLHYFDNLPTAGVRTRADRLKQYLMKRCYRNELQPGDKIALVGHSTGGLDIRALLAELKRVHDTVQAPQGEDPQDWAWERAQAQKLREMITRVVFMSVPQRGTNIADWVRSIGLGRRLTVSAMHLAADTMDMVPRPIERLRSALVEKANNYRVAPPTWVKEKLDQAVPDAYAALLDVVTEAEARGSGDPVRAAAAREGLAELTLWLDQTDGDFLAINDLSCVAPDPNLLLRAGNKLMALVSSSERKHEPERSFARATPEQRAEEQRNWKQLGIQVLSFATRAKPPHQGFRDSAWSRSYLVLPKLLGLPFGGKTDGVFRLVFNACASGPFHEVRSKIGAAEPDHRAGATGFPSGEPVPAHDIESWHNDGIINTASMLWPSAEETLLVEGDHGDIIGHYEQNRPNRVEARKYRSYDIFGSDSGFDDRRFEQIWFHTFNHCLSALPEL